MPIWWVGLVGIISLSVGAYWDVGWLLAVGGLSLLSAALGLLGALFRG